MTRRAGSGSRGGWGWAPPAPPRRAPARPPRRRVSAAAGSPGTPAAGGAGRARAGPGARGRGRGRRPRGLGRSAGPGSRVPAAFQGARGMTRAAPPRSPRPCWPPPSLLLLLLLLLLRRGQVAFAGDSCCDQITHSPTADEIRLTGVLGNISQTGGSGRVYQGLAGNASQVSLSGLTPDTSYNVTLNSSENCCRVQTNSSSVPDTSTVSPTSGSLTGADSATVASNSTDHAQTKGEVDAEGKDVASHQTEPSPVSDLRSDWAEPTEAFLTWTTENDTVSCQLLLAMGGTLQNLCSDTPVNVSRLEPGNTYCIAVCVPGSNSTLCVQSPQGAPMNESRNTSVLLRGLRPGSEYNVTVSPFAASGKEGPPQSVTFRTKPIQVSNLTAVDIHATNLTLTWTLSPDVSSSAFSYEVLVVWTTGSLNFTVQKTYMVINPLQPNTFYNITVEPMSGGSAVGPLASLQLYTPPLPVSNLSVASVNVTEIVLTWNSDVHQFMVLVRDGANNSVIQENATTNDNRFTIDNLLPGYEYLFEVIPLGTSGIKGMPTTISCRTENSAVYDVQVTEFTTTTLLLRWQSTDHGSEYTYHLSIWSDHNATERVVAHARELLLDHLNPGTLYNITVQPVLKNISGNASSISHYTRPSPACGIKASTNTTDVDLAWQNPDAAAPTYRYSVRLERGNASQSRETVTDVGVTRAAFRDLAPGSGYTVMIYTLVNLTLRSEQPGTLSFCMDPAPVTHFSCEAVPQKPTLVLRWACPVGTSAGFTLEVSGGAWSSVTTLDGCGSGNDTESRTDMVHLNFSTSYNISIATLSCNKTAPPSQHNCLTGITDPPRPKISPNITSFSHNSLTVTFSGFEASHGPIQAYALVLTTGEAANASAGDLKYTYNDFKKGDSDTYVTYLLTMDETRHSQGWLEASRYEVDVGNESMTYGYYNGKLDPLGSYRACVAGFTNITFKSHDRLIDGPESYVSFSPCSEAVFLPQDPGVICGAVFGCVFGALVIVAVGSFIFWRKKRKDAKNNEVSFSQIKPKKSKVIRVESFEAYFKKQQADSNCGFAEEYEDLKLVGISQPKYAAELAENREKNRYNNVLPYDISRVKLSIQTHSTDDYINANYIPGYHSRRDFIATQGPLPNTLKDFWRMVWEKNVHAIIMLTKCVEQGRTKCEEYWPSKKTQEYGDITVANTSEIILPEWTIRDFTVKNSRTSESRPLRQFHLTSWPDHGVPDTTELLINFRFLVRDYMKQVPPESPILVHCSAGVGRTGTFIAIDRLIYQIENENTVDVYGIVYDLRMHRPLMVQTEDQYVFLNQCVLDIIRAQKDSRVDLIYQNTSAMTIYENLTPGSTFGKTNGYIA